MHTTRLAASIGCALLLLAATATAHAFPRVDLRFGGQTQWMRDGSWDLVDEGSDTWGAVSPSVGFRITPNLALHLGYRYGESQAELLGHTASSALRLHDASLSVSYEVDLIPWVRGFARMGGAAMFGLFDLSLPGGEERESQAWAPGFFVTGGMLLVPEPLRGWALRESGLLSETTVGLSVEVGYAAYADLEVGTLAAASSPRHEGGAIARPDLELGSMRMSGWTWRLGIVLLF